MVLAIIFTAFLINYLRYTDLFWVLAWPGTVVHESLHWVTGLLFNAKPTEFSVMPQHREKSGQTVGYVDFANLTWYNGLPTGLAPVLGILPVLYIMGTIQPGWSAGTIFQVWLAGSILSQCWPSRQDRKVAFHSWTGIALYASIVAGFVML